MCHAPCTLGSWSPVSLDGTNVGIGPFGPIKNDKFPECTQMICGLWCVGGVGGRMKYVLGISELKWEVNGV